MKYQLYPLGDTAIIVEFGQAIDLDTHQKVKALSRLLDEEPFAGLLEYIPAYTTVTLFYDPLCFLDANPYKKVCLFLEGLLEGLQVSSEEVARIVEIPVCYGGEYGPDLNFVAEHNKLTPEEVIEIHSRGEYLVYMIGFAPGFPYIGGMSEKIATPRRPSPRLAIPEGSVGIAGKQTGVYPIETPGGWQLIGRTPLALFRPKDSSPSLLRAGEQVRFLPISSDEYQAIKEAGE